MKKFLFLGLLVASTSVFSQQRNKKDIEVTPFIGFLSSKYHSGIFYDDYSQLHSFTVGVNGDYFINDRWSLKSGIFYQTQGVKVVASPFVSAFKEKLNYLTIPINGNWHFGKTRGWNLNFGPSLGLLLSAKHESNTGKIDIKNRAKSFQIGLSAGIGYKVKVSEKMHILIDYQAMASFTDTSKEERTVIKNSYYSFNVGTVFKL